jgi:tRNA A-37 threonylcarbamoyl transferase component Bud32
MKLTINELQALLVKSEIIQDSQTGPKVVKLENGNYLKFFRLKTWFSSALFYHYADRFFDNHKKLTELGVVTIKPVRVYIIPKNFITDSKLTKAVEYEYLPGQTLRSLIQNNKFAIDVIEPLAYFIAKLHNKGIYFKAIHFANILYNTDFLDKFGLIDIDNTRVFKQPLNFQLRQRNFKHMIRYAEDKAWLQQHKQRFLDIYLANSVLNKVTTNKLRLLLDT